MKLSNVAEWLGSSALAVLAAILLSVSAVSVAAQGVTTASITGIVKDSSGGVMPGVTVVATHQPSGTTYEAVTQGDGRYVIPGMRVGGPYKVSAAIPGFNTQEQDQITLTLGVTQDLEFSLKPAALSETVVVTAETSPVFSSGRTGAATAVTRVELATLPTITGRLTDVTRLTPQYGGNGSFAGQDNRSNNITIDGSYFNGSFGLQTTTGGIGDRTGVAPISLEAIEQVQVNVAPYDVRQGNFVGANVNAVTRSGANRFSGSFYSRYRDESFIGTKANGQTFNPGTFKTTNNGEWAGGPIVKNKLFFFQSFEKQSDSRPLTTFQSNPGGVPAAGNITRVLASDLSALSSYLMTNFKYDTGPFDNISKDTPGKPWMVKGDYNVSRGNKVTFRYNQLNSRTAVAQNGSSALGTSRPTNTVNFLSFENSNYAIIENVKSGVGEWNSVFGKFTNNLLAGYTKQDESRDSIQLFPFVVIGDGAGGVYTSFGSEPFTPFNLLRYSTFQAQDSVSRFAGNHTLTFGGAVEKFHSDNSFYFGIQSAYSYASLADFYTDANGFLANPNRTVAAAASRFQVKYLLQAGQTTPPLQPLDVFYTSGYAQDEWRLRSNFTLTAGVRVDVPRFGDTAFDNPAADALTFLDHGSPVQYNSGGLPDTTPYWSPRVGFNWDLTSDGSTQVRGGSGLFSGKPPYVWISNQIGNTGVLFGFVDSLSSTTAFPFNPNPDKYKPAPTGGVAASYELDVTDQDYRFPQTFRTNIGIDRRLPLGLIGTADFIYNKDLNAPVYLNANLPAANTSFTGVDNRPRWAANATPNSPACVTTLGSENGPCVQKINNARGNAITAAYVLKNSSDNHSWNISGALSRPMTHGFAAKFGFNYGVSRSLVEPSSTAGTSWGGANAVPGDPNSPPLAYSTNSPGKRVFLQTSYTKEYFGFGATTVSMFYDAHTNGNTSFLFAGDANGDTVIGNDLIYIPRSTSDMNFKSLTLNGVVITPAQQAEQFEKLIAGDAYLSKHRGEYAQRGGVFLPVVNRIDMSITQDVFKTLSSSRHTGQIRLDLFNFGNLLNSNWGAGTRLINTQILTSPSADANGALTYNLQTLNGALLANTRQTSAGLGLFGLSGQNDIWSMMLSFRYTFN